ncbi:trypsin-like serine protease [Myxococcota bacterium]
MSCRSRTLFLFAFWSIACGDAPVWHIPPMDHEAIVNGTRNPDRTHLTTAQIEAIGFLGDSDSNEFCSGTLVRPRVAITAQHCVFRRSPSSTFFGLGVQPATTDVLLPTQEIHIHPTLDFALLILGVDATGATEVVPIDINRDPMSEDWDGRWVDAAGYGDTHTEATGRFFAGVQIVDWSAEIVTVDGHGREGICYGDSGGPIIWQPDEITDPVVVGVESWGDSSCVDRDHLTRVDKAAAFVDEVLSQSLPPPLEPCGDVDFHGECRGSEVVWCANAYLQFKECSEEDMVCGWLGPTWGFDCMPSECGTIDYRGHCDGTILSWCRRDGLGTRDCAETGEVCTWVNEEIGHNCTDCTRCGGECTDLGTSVEHCGGCDNPCTPPHATGVCEGGVCQIGTCGSGYQDADGAVINGCEKSLTKKKKDGGCAAAPRSLAAGLAVLGLLGLFLRATRKRPSSDRLDPRQKCRIPR